MQRIAILLLALSCLGARLVDSGSATHKVKDTSAATHKLRDLLPSEMPTCTLIPNTVLVSGTSSGTATVKDALLNTFTGATVTATQNIQANVPLYSPLGTPTVSFADKSATKVVTVGATTGQTTYFASGTASILMQATYGSSVIGRMASFASSQTGGTTATTFGSYVSGSLSAALVTQFNGTLLSGLTASPSVASPATSTQALYSAANDTTGVYVRNTNLFAAGVDLTCLPVWNSYLAPSNQGNKYNGVLVTPQHVLMANHAHPGSGTLRFVDNSNNTVTATIASVAAVPGTVDLALCTLTAPLSSAITPAKVLPATWRSQLPQVQYGAPVIFQNQFRQLAVGDLVLSASGSGTMSIAQSADSTRGTWWISPITGDSGSGCGTIIAGQFVALTDWYSIGYGPCYSDDISVINTAIGGSYTLTQATVSSYSAY